MPCLNLGILFFKIHDTCEEKDIDKIEDKDQYDDESISITTLRRSDKIYEDTSIYSPSYEDDSDYEDEEDNSMNRIKRCNSPCELAANETDQCAICYINKKRYVYIPCGHLCMCGECANKIEDVCPICKIIVSNIIKTY